MKNITYIIILSWLFILSSAQVWGQDEESLNEQFDLNVQFWEYYNAEEYENAIKVGEKILSFYENSSNNFLGLLMLQDIGDCYYGLKEYDTAMNYYMRVIENNSKEREYDVYWAILERIGNCYYGQGDINNAIKKYKEAMKILHDDPYYNSNENKAILYERIALCYYYQGEYTFAYTNMLKSLDYGHLSVLKELRTLTTEERVDYWNENSNTYLSILPMIASANYSNNPLAARYMYDMSALFAKGVLLSADTEFERLINESGDAEAINSLNTLKNVRTQINSLREKGAIGENIQNLDSIKDSIETALLNRLWKLDDSSGDFTQNLRLTWKDVQKNLDSTSIAIEFLSFSTFELESKTKYIALVVRPGFQFPKMIEVCEEDELKAAAEKPYTSNELSKLIWGKLANELNGVKTIYFSPSGELHKIAIESMPHWEKAGKMMGYYYNIYRLSSTRELAMKHSDVEGNGTVLYGGIRYTCSIEDMAEPKRGHHEPKNAEENIALSKSKKGVEHYDTKAAGLRDDTSLDYLQESRFEVDGIEKVLGENVEKIIECDATETSFKNLSGEKKKNIHIATHGYYWNDSTAKQLSSGHQLRALQQGVGSNEEDKAMSLSGLFFSGAQNNFGKDRKTIPDTIDDGVLTAKEISNLDLRGADMVVLSACQTGLGDIVGSEGVFGLQRGFKKAGVQSIIMSLWPVDDKATKEFMLRFYQELKNHKTKRQAFNIAQDQLKNTYGNFEDKEHETPTSRPHWAAFILLDGLEK